MLLTATAFALPAEAARIRRPHVPRQHATVQTETFTLAKDARIAVGSNHSASLSDIRVGDLVHIGYLQEKGALVARHITDGVQRNAVHPGKGAGTKTQHHVLSSTLSHAQGVVRSVDVQGSTVTIAKKH